MLSQFSTLILTQSTKQPTSGYLKLSWLYLIPILTRFIHSCYTASKQFLLIIIIIIMMMMIMVMIVAAAAAAVVVGVVVVVVVIIIY